MRIRAAVRSLLIPLCFALPARAAERKANPLTLPRLENQTLRQFDADSLMISNGTWSNVTLVNAWVHMVTGQNMSLRNFSADKSTLPGFELRDSSWIGGRISNSQMARFRAINTFIRNVDFSGIRAPVWKAVRSSFIGCDFRGADLSNAVFLLSRFDGSLINDKTLLPMSKEKARALGFRYAP